MSNRHFAAAVVLVCLLVVACSDSDGGTTSTPPANVAGFWDISMQNSAQAKLVSCTGDMDIFNNVTVADVMEGGSTCTPVSGSGIVVQNGDAFTITPVSVECTNGSSSTTSGSGSISGMSLSGQLDTVDSLGVTSIERFTGAVSGVSLTVESNEMSVSGPANGKCDIRPNLMYSGQIVQAKRSGRPRVRLGSVIETYLRSK
jgi:hypothetical protein